MDTSSLTRSFSSLLLDTAAKGTVLLLLACVATWLYRKSSAALRHSIWCLTMAGLLLLPIAAWLLPAWQLPILPPVPTPVAEVVRLLPSPPALPAPAVTIEPTSHRAPVISQRQPTLAHAPSPPVVIPTLEPQPTPPFVESIAESTTSPLSTVESVSLVVSAGWALGVTLFGTLLLVGLGRTVRMRSRSVVIGDGEWSVMLTELRQRLGLSRSVELREHAASVVPLTWGIWRPVVLVPQLARAWAEPMRRAVLLHELAHVQRGDVACQVLGRLTCVLYWFHPLAWLALRQLRQEREQACDDAVVQSGEKASDYAEQLLAVARMCCAPRGLSLGVAMAEGSSLERRVKSLFDSARSHGPLTRRVAVASILIGGAILAGLAPIQPTPSQAEPVKAPVASSPDAPPVEPAGDPTKSRPPKNADEHPFPLELCQKAFSDPESLVQLERLNPVYGEAKRGIQLGLAINSRSQTVAVGERFPLMLVYRNTGKTELTFHISQDHWNRPCTVQDANGRSVQVSFVMHWMFIAPLKITLKPGEVWCEMTPGLYLGERMPSIKPVAGKYKLTYPQGIWDVNTTPQLRTDLPDFTRIPSLPPDTSLKTPDSPPDSPPAPDTPVETPVGQIVEMPTWSEQLNTGTIEFEIAPTPDGKLEARVLAMAQDVEMPNVNKQPEVEPMPVGQESEAKTSLNDHVIWGKAIDGLESGLWLLKTGEPLNQRVPLESMVTYQVVVRNSAQTPRDIFVQLNPFVGEELPYLIPSEQIAPALELPEWPQQFRAMGHPNRNGGWQATYIVHLDAGESMKLPGEFTLWVGQSPPLERRFSPRVETITPGMNWVVQPVLAKALTAAEVEKYTTPMKLDVTLYNADGKSRSGQAILPAWGIEGQRLAAKIQLEVGTLNAAASRNAEKAIWGEVDRGMQCGIRVLNPLASYQTGDTLEAELLYWNASDAAILNTLPSTLDLYPIIEQENDSQSIDFGARSRLRPGWHNFQPGEVRSLGVVKVTLVPEGTPSPKSNEEPGHVTLKPGKYQLSGSGGVGGICPRSGKYEFVVMNNGAAAATISDTKPLFTELVVSIQPFEAPRNGFIEELKFLADGKCWYKVEGREAAPNQPARNGAVFDHTLSGERIRQLNQLLGDTKWLTAEAGAKGQPPPLHATAYRLTLRRDGQVTTLDCTERGIELYQPLLHFLDGIAAQERRVYRHDYIGGQEGTDAWQEIGRELAALRGEPYGKSPYDIDYARYQPIAVRIVRDHHGQRDEELIPSLRLIGHLQVQLELEFIHHMAHDRSSHVRQEMAWTLGKIHDPESLPVLLGMMSAAGTRWDVGFELIQWGDDAVPGIVKLIELSTNDGPEERERGIGEDMIRAYLEHWDKIAQPIPADVVSAVKDALKAKNPQNGGIRTTYHEEFLKKVAQVPVDKTIKPVP